MSNRKLAPLVLLGAACTAFSLPAAADLPPPDGSKYVDFAFKVDGIAAAKDFVLLAYPCGPSSGTPSSDAVEVKEGVAISVGRRGGTCKLYSASRADYDAWKKATPDAKGPALEAFFTSAKVKACTGTSAPDIVMVIPSTDPRSTVTQALHVTKLDGGGCVLAKDSSSATSSAGGPGAPGGSSSGSAAAPPPTAAPTATPTSAPLTATPPPSPPAKDSGCAVSSTGAESTAGAFGAFALFGLALAARRRRAS